MKVAFILFPETHLLDLAGPAQALHSVNQFQPDTLQLDYLASTPTVLSHQGLEMSKLKLLAESDGVYDLVVVNGSKFRPSLAKRVDTEYREEIAWLKKYYQAGSITTLASVCSGSFFLAQAGLLAHRSCTTHHLLTDDLQALEPSAHVKRQHLYVWDGSILTSAGVTAGVDMILAWISHVLGASLAGKIARDLLVYSRHENEALSPCPLRSYRDHLDQLVHRLQDRILQAPEAAWTAEDIEKHISLGYRQISRRFRLATGVSIKQYQLALRLHRAEALLKNSDKSIDVIAELLGFQSAHAFRKAWYTQMTISPSDYRHDRRTL